jgi:transposase
MLAARLSAAGPLSQWLFGTLAEAELPVVCVETRHMQAVLKAQINKTDRNDARGIAQMIRVGLYRPVHVKTIRSQKLRMLLTHRQLLQSKAIAIENDLRGTLRNFGLKVGMVGKVRFEARIKELVENLPDLATLDDDIAFRDKLIAGASFWHASQDTGTMKVQQRLNVGNPRYVPRAQDSYNPT